jgi:hypothetical protein
VQQRTFRVLFMAAAGLLAMVVGCVGSVDNRPSTGAAPGAGSTATPPGTGGTGAAPATGGSPSTSGTGGSVPATGGTGGGIPAPNGGTGGSAPATMGGSPPGAPPPDAAAPVDTAPPLPPCPEAPGPGAVQDPRTCLIWERQSAGNLTNKQAARRCDGLALDGKDDWRAPAPEEIASWGDLPVNSNAYITNPIYIPAGASDRDGCEGNSHSCNIGHYNRNAVVCAWQGVGFSGPSLCVRGKPRDGTLSAAHVATACDACKVHLSGAGADFKLANCLPFAR